MLIIRQQQIASFRPELERAFIQRVADWVEQRHPGAAAVRDVLEERIVAAYHRARGYSMTSRRDVALFVDLDMRLGPAFELQPENAWMKGILGNVGLSGPTRIYRIECRLERLAAVAASRGEDNDA